ncbi:MAG TPA: hypothetical protein VMF08_13870 [Candidatus Sulfotelmatobacter sp.]|nr:hypothetical protein [Candidatus Sulfotelmatobacter sp.]
MGLSINFEFTAAAGVTAARAEEIVASWHDLAISFEREGFVDKVLPIASDLETLNRFACDFLILPVPGEENTSTGVEIVPMAGWIFLISVGKGCEPLRLGLCRYPETVRYHGKKLPTDKPARWRIFGFCKTQYASVHGWEHFKRCHCAVVHLLAACRMPDLDVNIMDEGAYWPERSVSKLRENLDRMNGLVAATAGALKDAVGESSDAVKSPIFEHKNFERLEAQGAPHVGEAVEALRAVLRK